MDTKKKSRKKRARDLQKKLKIETVNTWDGYMKVNGKWYPSKEGWKEAKKTLLTLAGIFGLILLGILLTDIHMIFE